MGAIPTWGGKAILVVLAVAGFVHFNGKIGPDAASNGAGANPAVAAVPALTWDPEKFCSAADDAFWKLTEAPPPQQTLKEAQSLAQRWHKGGAISADLTQAVRQRLLSLHGTPHCAEAEKLMPDILKIVRSVERERGERVAYRVSVEGLTWRKGGFGSVAVASFTLKNKSRHLPVRDIVLTCAFYGPSGTELSSKTQTIYERIEPGKSKRIKELSVSFINQQASNAGCEVVGGTAL